MASDLDVWLAYTPTAAETLSLEPRWLSPAEHERSARFKFDVDRLRYERARLLLRSLLGEQLGCAPADVPLEIGLHGRPLLSKFADEVRISFNVAHSGDWALVGICRSRLVGVDIEVIRDVPEYMEIAKRDFLEHEHEHLAARETGNQQTAFHRLWTRKEACLKAIGLGIPGGLDRFDVLGPPDADNHGQIRSDSDSQVVRTIGARGNHDELWVGTLNCDADIVASVAFSGEFVSPNVHLVGTAGLDLRAATFPDF